MDPSCGGGAQRSARRSTPPASVASGARGTEGRDAARCNLLRDIHVIGICCRWQRCRDNAASLQDSVPRPATLAPRMPQLTLGANLIMSVVMTGAGGDREHSFHHHLSCGAERSEAPVGRRVLAAADEAVAAAPAVAPSSKSAGRHQAVGGDDLAHEGMLRVKSDPCMTRCAAGLAHARLLRRFDERHLLWPRWLRGVGAGHSSCRARRWTRYAACVAERARAGRRP
jgi:hypothetical protein